MQRIFLTGLALVILLGACVPNRKYVYLQKDDVNAKGLPVDTVVRKYNLQIQEYHIQPLDILSIRLESLTDDEFDFMTKLYPQNQQMGGMGNLGPQISGFMVDNAGNIEFPVVGKIRLSGLTLFQAQDKLQEIFKAYLKNPVARVRLLNFRFTVLGEVRNENQITSSNPRVTLVEAIGLAGGLTDMADRSNIKVIRQVGSETEVLYMNMLSEELLQAQHYYIQQNDIIIVPALRQRPFRQYWGQNISIILSTLSILLVAVNQFK